MGDGRLSCRIFQCDYFPNRYRAKRCTAAICQARSGRKRRVFGWYKGRRSPPAKETSGCILSPYFRNIAAAGPIIRGYSAVNRRGVRRDSAARTNSAGFPCAGCWPAPCAGPLLASGPLWRGLSRRAGTPPRRARTVRRASGKSGECGTSWCVPFQATRHMPSNHVTPGSSGIPAVNCNSRIPRVPLGFEASRLDWQALSRGCLHAPARSQCPRPAC